MRLRRAVQRGRWFNYDYKTFLLEMKERGIKVGGCGGKKRRERAKQAAATIDNNFNSIGKVEDQKKNLELTVRLIGEIGQDGAALPCCTENDRIFLQDCRIKINQGGNHTMFGWRQVENVVRIHTVVTQYRKEHTPYYGTAPQSETRLPGNADRSGKGQETRPNEARHSEGRDVKVGTPLNGRVR